MINLVASGAGVVCGGADHLCT